MGWGTQQWGQLPWGYLPLAIPTCADWPCLCIGESEMPNIFTYPGIYASRGTPWMTIDGNNDLVMRSDDGIASIFTFDIPIGTKFTFETTFIPSLLPINLDDLSTSRMLIAVYDAQDNAGGILISRHGLAIVSSYGNSVLPILGSNDIILEGSDYYTMRLLVDGESNVMDLYITKTDDLITLGHQLRYTTAAPITPQGTADHLRLEILGHPQTPVEAKFSTLYCNCTQLVIPNRRPIADVGQDQTAALGSIVQLDGTASYDPEGLPVSYVWYVFGTPENSAFRHSGLDGKTQDDGDADGVTNVFETVSDAFSLANASALQPGDMLLVDGVQYEISTDDWVWDASANRFERGGTFDPKKITITDDALLDNLSAVSWEIYYQNSFFDDRASPQPTFTPDVTGMYAIQLVVNDGQLNSLPDQGLANIAENNLLLGHVPDLNFVWDYLSDAWSLFEDMGPITTFWSGFAQIASNILLTAWQLDYAKSLRDIQRTFQRRWLGYRPLFEEPATDRDDSVIALVRGNIVSDDITGGITFGADKTLILTKDGGSEVTVTLSGTLSEAEIAAAITTALGETLSTKTAQIRTEATSNYLSLEYSGLLVVDKDGTANSLFGWSETEDTENSYKRADGGSIGTATTAFVVNNALVDFVAKNPSRQALLTFGGTGYEVQKIASTKQLTTIQELASVSGRTDWELCSYITAANTDFDDELVLEGDILILEIRQSGMASTEQVLCKVIGSRNNSVAFNPRPLYEATLGQIDNYEVTLYGVQRCSAIPVSELVMRIPRLQEIILDPPTFLTENRDYFIREDTAGTNGVWFAEGLYSFDDPPPDILWAEVTHLDNRPMIEDNFGKAVDFTLEDLDNYTEDLDYLSAVRGLWYAFFHAPSLFNVRIGVQILLGLPFAEVDGVVTEINETFDANQIRMLIQDAADASVVRSYFIPRSAYFEEEGWSMVAINPSTGVEYAIGDNIEQFYPISKGVEVADWVSDPEWWLGYQGQGAMLEVEKFFHFMVQADVDVFNITNILFAIEFCKKIKPTIGYPLWVAFKRIPHTSISVTDFLQIFGTLLLVDNPTCASRITAAGSGGAYRFDDTDESGNYNWAWDGVPNVPTAPSGKPEFLYDKKRLCPGEQLQAIIQAGHGGSYFPFDWVWAFDDSGGSDTIPLSGPDSSPPAPYGPAVGIVKFDTTYAAGTYTRGKIL